MKEIKLTQGKLALVDDEDFERLNQYRWYANKRRQTFYVLTNLKKKGNYKPITMHRIIMNAKKGQEVDHKDGNGLNNQKSNLRICTCQQNGMNRMKQLNNTSGYKGVCWHKDVKKWISRITINQKRIYLGSFDNKEDAKNAYDKKSKELFGEYARSEAKE